MNLYIQTLVVLGQAPLPQAPIQLTPKQLKQVQDACADAFKVVTHKILPLLQKIAFLGRLPPRDSRLDCALMANFNLSQGDPNYRTCVGEILRRFNVIHVLHERRDEIRISPTLGVDCTLYKAYVLRVIDPITGKTASTIFACNGFFAHKKPIEKTATIIHELLHAYVGVGLVRLPPVIDVEYSAEPYKAGCAPQKKWDLPTLQLISNGQSYEGFVLNLLEGSKEDTKEMMVKGK